MVPSKPHDHGADCDHDHGPAGEPFRRSEPKIGRNDPCHCGSGKKFKKCHALVVAEAPAEPDASDGS